MGRPIPAPFNDPPQIPPGAGVFVQAFNDLSEDRQRSTEHVHNITAKSIREWAREFGYYTDTFFMEELTAHVQAMDKVWIEVEIKRLRKLHKGKGRGSDGSTKRVRQATTEVRRQRKESAERD